MNLQQQWGSAWLMTRSSGLELEVLWMVVTVDFSHEKRQRFLQCMAQGCIEIQKLVTSMADRSATETFKAWPGVGQGKSLGFTSSDNYNKLKKVFITAENGKVVDGKKIRCPKLARDSFRSEGPCVLSAPTTGWRYSSFRRATETCKAWPRAGQGKSLGFTSADNYNKLKKVFITSENDKVVDGKRICRPKLTRDAFRSEGPCVLGAPTIGSRYTSFRSLYIQPKFGLTSLKIRQASYSIRSKKVSIRSQSDKILAGIKICQPKQTRDVLFSEKFCVQGASTLDWRYSFRGDLDLPSIVEKTLISLVTTEAETSTAPVAVAGESKRLLPCAYVFWAVGVVRSKRHEDDIILPSPFCGHVFIPMVSIRPQSDKVLADINIRYPKQTKDVFFSEKFSVRGASMLDWRYSSFSRPMNYLNIPIVLYLSRRTYCGSAASQIYFTSDAANELPILCGMPVRLSRLFGHIKVMHTTATIGTFYFCFEYEDDSVPLIIDGREGWFYAFRGELGIFEFKHGYHPYVNHRNLRRLPFTGDYPGIAPSGYDNLPLGLDIIRWAIQIVAAFGRGEPVSQEDLQTALSVLVHYACEGTKMNSAFEWNCESMVNNILKTLRECCPHLPRKIRKWRRLSKGSLDAAILKLAYPNDEPRIHLPNNLHNITTWIDALNEVNVFQFNALERPPPYTNARDWGWSRIGPGVGDPRIQFYGDEEPYGGGAGGEPHVLSKDFICRRPYNEEVISIIPDSRIIRVEETALLIKEARKQKRKAWAERGRDFKSK
ncbi:hypothetical protein EJB05_39091, partial [Eragrostis curvula]